MIGRDDHTIARASRRRRRWRLAEDALLLPLALLVELLERVVWNGTLALLDLISRAPPIARLRLFLQGLPPLIVVFLFLIPEAVDHLSGFWATMLLVKGNWVGATIIAVFVKGFAILLGIWIYQACEESLLSVRWFAVIHSWVIAAKNRVLARTAPIRTRLRLALRAMVTRHGSRRLARRFAAWRLRLARMAGRLRR